MILETLVGKFTVTAQTAGLRADLWVVADSRESLVSLLDSVELVGGAYGHERAFTDADIETVNSFGRERFRVKLTRAEVVQFIQAEVFSYLDYTSAAGFHRAQEQA